MPYEIKQIGDCFKVINTDTGKIFSYCTTYANAVRQIRLLRMIEKKT